MFPLFQLFRRIGRFEQLDVIKISVKEVFYRVEFCLKTSPINAFFEWTTLRTKILVHQGASVLSNQMMTICP